MENLINHKKRLFKRYITNKGKEMMFIGTLSYVDCTTLTVEEQEEFVKVNFPECEVVINLSETMEDEKSSELL